MGRLDDIIERNRNPSAARQREAKAEPKISIAPPRATAGKNEDRLRDIIERNKNPGRGQRGKRIGMTLVPIILLAVLLLLIFTNLAQPEDDAPPPKARSGDQRVRDIRLWTPPAKASPAKGSAANGSAAKAPR